MPASGLFKSSARVKLSCDSLNMMTRMNPGVPGGTEPMSGWGGICSIKAHVNHVRMSYCLTPNGLAAKIKSIFPLWVTKPWLFQSVKLTKISEPFGL